MFGLINGKDNWKWAAFGKHPFGGDFLKAGDITPLLKSFSQWVDKGHSGLSRREKSDLSFSWRFWAKGPNKELICGIIQSSVDKYGRQYPLLIIGSGLRQSLNKNWHLIPYACEKSWEQLERFQRNEFKNIKELKRELKKSTAPADNLQELVEISDAFRNVKIEDSEKGSNSDFMNKMNNIEALARVSSFTVHIDIGEKDRALVPASKLLLLLKTRSGVEPDVVFLGESDDEKRLFCLKRSLTIDDFRKLCGREKKMERIDATTRNK